MEEEAKNQLVKVASLHLAEIKSTTSLAARGLAALAETQRSALGILHNLSALEEAAKQGNADAQFGVAEANALRDIRESDIWKILALGNADGTSVGSPSWLLWAARRLNTKNTPVGKEGYDATHWYLLAAIQGHIAAQFYLAGRYATGCGVDQDDFKAIEWYRMAAERDSAASQFHLGMMYLQGRGVERNDAQARAWFNKAAERGNPDGQTKLGLSYLFGVCSEVNIKDAIKWLKLAADKNQRDAQFHLGEIYSSDQFVAKNIEMSRAWYLKAASLGHERAIERIGAHDDEQST